MMRLKCGGFSGALTIPMAISVHAWTPETPCVTTCGVEQVRWRVVAGIDRSMLSSQSTGTGTMRVEISLLIRRLGKCGAAGGGRTKPTCMYFVADILVVVVVVVLCVLALAYRALGAFLVVLPIEKDRVIKRSVEGYFSPKCVSPLKK